MNSTILVFGLIIFTPLLMLGTYYLGMPKELGGLIVLAFFYLAYRLYENSFKSRVKTGYLGNEEEFIDSILELTAIVIKVDGVVKELDIAWVKNELIEDFKSPYSEEFIDLFLSKLDEDISLGSISKKVNRHFDISGKIQLINFLVRLCAIDNTLTDNEYKLLQRIIKLFRLNNRILRSFLAMHNLRIKTKRQKTYSRPKSRSFKLSMQVAYEILGINESASIRAVKKAYRKLAVIHHPDKVAYLGEKFQENASNKFQKISDAYELIKSRKKFS
ncbi:MAG: DnaJ like chaperone protein [Arenicella sp.]|jgi:DnaJ like chaperone protein